MVSHPPFAAQPRLREERGTHSMEVGATKGGPPVHQVGATTIDGATYTYDNAGNRLTKVNHLNAVTETYGYDNIYQLLSVVQGATTTESYTYDKVGNRLSEVIGATYTVNNSNQLTSISGSPGTTFSHDNNGNTVT